MVYSDQLIDVHYHDDRKRLLGLMSPSQTDTNKIWQTNGCYEKATIRVVICSGKY
ncbi:hypothetical protein HXA32_11995 [Salipaludibacillus agaradhaerens]|uniref:hypothetical protein n=1 Tax=Salipaludibacillus agaradhaerens TaxID=76935 RepID=UPI00215126CB|nr:hypothetical protein [Salipaludibacillus agaradhaerens]MCR6106995.1 hypothetical protein [Salipaludibacillus agaradhaerens]